METAFGGQPVRRYRKRPAPRGGRTLRLLQNHAGQIVEATLHERPLAAIYWTI